MKSTWFSDKRGYELMKLVMDGHSEHRSQTVFRDWIRCMSLTLLQRAHGVAGGFCQKTEDEVLEIQRRYPKWKTTFAPAFGQLVTIYLEALKEGRFEDFLGKVYEELGASNQWHGQFFTPIAISKVMAQLTLGTQEEFEAAYASDPRRVRISEPACGAGSTLLGCWELLQQWKVPPSAVYFFAIDLDPMCVDMCFIQCTLYGMPATIYNENTLRNPTCEGSPAYTTAMARMFPLKGETGLNIQVANPPFGGKIDINELHYSLGGKAGLKPDSKATPEPRASPAPSPGKTPPIRQSTIRDR